MTAAGGKGLGEGAPTHGLAQRAGRPGGGGAAAVSYTHLTLPTIA